MIEHLHRGRRIANLVGDLGGQEAEHGEFLILAQLVFDLAQALVETRLLDGDGREFGQCGQAAYFFVRDCFSLDALHQPDGGAREQGIGEPGRQPGGDVVARAQGEAEAGDEEIGERDEDAAGYSHKNVAPA